MAAIVYHSSACVPFTFVVSLSLKIMMVWVSKAKVKEYKYVKF